MSGKESNSKTSWDAGVWRSDIRQSVGCLVGPGRRRWAVSSKLFSSVENTDYPPPRQCWDQHLAPSTQRLSAVSNPAVVYGRIGEQRFSSGQMQFRSKSLGTVGPRRLYFPERILYRMRWFRAPNPGLLNLADAPSWAVGFSLLIAMTHNAVHKSLFRLKTQFCLKRHILWESVSNFHTIKHSSFQNWDEICAHVSAPLTTRWLLKWGSLQNWGDPPFPIIPKSFNLHLSLTPLGGS